MRLLRGRGRAESLALSAARLPDPATRTEAIASELHVKVGQTLPDLGLIGLDGERTSMRALLKPGRRLLVNLWATWCLPCGKEMPELERRRESFAERGLDLVGVSVDTERDAPVVELARARVRYPVYRIEPAELARLYATEAITVPLSFVVEADGRVAELIPGWSFSSRRRFEEIPGPAVAPGSR